MRNLSRRCRSRRITKISNSDTGLKFKIKVKEECIPKYDQTKDLIIEKQKLLVEKTKTLKSPNLSNNKNLNISQKYQCLGCEKTFLTLKNYTNHNSRFGCDFVPANKSVNSAKTRRPYGSAIYTCDKCEETFKSRKMYYTHKKTHEPKKAEDIFYKYDETEELYICEVCSAEFELKEEVEAHIDIHSETFPCLICEEKFKSPFDLGMHSVAHNDDNIIQCPLCAYTTLNHKIFRTHLNKIHIKKYSWYCSTCKKGFFYKHRLKEHELHHTGDRPFNCSICSTKFLLDRYLKKHLIQKHYVVTGLNNVCVKCHVYFYRPESLKTHQVKCIARAKITERSFLCTFCGHGFKKQYELKDHMRIHTGEKPFVCTYCGEGYRKREYLMIHTRVHTGEKPYSCEYCGKGFGQRSPFKVHLRTHTGERPYTCSFCGRGFLTNQCLKLHVKNCNQMKKTRRRRSRKIKLKISKFEIDIEECNIQIKEESSVDNKYECDKCQKVFSSKKWFQKHKTKADCDIIGGDRKSIKIKKEEKDKVYQCKTCMDVFASKDLFKKHKEIHKASDLVEESPSYRFDILQDLYICDLCSAEFQVREEADKHMQTHVEKQHCNSCDKTFDSIYELGLHSRDHDPEGKITCPSCTSHKSDKPHNFKSHVDLVHLRKDFFYCKTCGKGFHKIRVYEEHLMTHREDKPFSCVVCSIKYSSYKNLVKHQIKSHQVGIAGHKMECMICNTYFYRPESLLKHQEKCIAKKMEIKEKNYLCPYCGHSFRKKFKMDEHIRVHTGENPFVCTICGKGFKKKESLKIHERVHTGEKPYSCEFCGKRFGQHAPFRVHIRTHTGERPYVCPFCSKGFTTNQGLKLHKKNCGETKLNNFVKYDMALGLI